MCGRLSRVLFVLLTVCSGLFGQVRGDVGRLSEQLRSAGPSTDVARVVEARSAALEALIRTDPDEALRAALPQDSLSRVAAMAPRAAALLEQRGAWQGEAEILTEDSPDLHTGRLRARVRLGGEVVDVFFSDRNRADLACTRTLRVEGIRVRSSIAASNAEQVEKVSSGACSTIGEQRFAVLMVKVPGSSDPVITPEQARQSLFGSSGVSLNTYWREVSHGRAWATGDVVGWLTLDRAYSCEESNEIREAAIRAAGSSIDLAAYNRLLIVLPPLGEHCHWQGLATWGCAAFAAAGRDYLASSIWIQMYPDHPPESLATLAIHEGGHSLGLLHSIFWDFAPVVLGPPGDPGLVYEYGDSYSAMAGGLGHYAAPQKLYLGWLDASEVITIQSSGTTRIAPMTGAMGAPKAVRVPRLGDTAGWLWLEYRQPVGVFESTLLTDAFDGALVHFQSGSELLSTALLDLTPAEERGQYHPWQPTLKPGMLWSDLFGSAVLSVSDLTPDGVTVRVSRTGSCVSLQPAYAVHPGAESSGSVTVEAPSSCIWGASSGADWVRIEGPASGAGRGAIRYRLSPSPSDSPRYGLIQVSGRHTMVRQEPKNQPPTFDSASPTSGSGPSPRFQLTFIDPNNAPDIAYVRVNLTEGAASSPGCLLEFDYQNRQVRLASEDGLQWTSWQPQERPGVENGRCAVLMVFGSQHGQDNHELMVLDFRVLLKGQSPRQLRVYAVAEDLSGSTSGWSEVATWKQTPNLAPSALSVRPSEGGGQVQQFLVSVSDPDGAGDIGQVRFSFGPHGSLCDFTYRPESVVPTMGSATFLGTAGYVTHWAGIPGTISNAYCALDLGGIVPRRTGNDLSVSFPISFKPAFQGPNELHVTAQDWTGVAVERSGAWRWTAEAAPAVALTPLSGSSRFGFFTIQASDANGVGDIAEVGLAVGEGDRNCTVSYLPATGEVRFLGQTWRLGDGAAPGSTNCRLHTYPSSATVAGGSITLHLYLEFLLNSVGTHDTVAWATDLGGMTSTAGGTWTVPDEFPPSIEAPSVRNSASFLPGPVAPGELITLYGRNLGPETVQEAGWNGNDLETSIANYQVLMNGVPAPMIHIFKTQITAVVPNDVPAGGMLNLQVIAQGRPSNQIEVPLAPAAPGIFRWPGRLQAIVINQDNTYAKDQPAPRGSIVTFFATGAGINSQGYPAGRIPAGPDWPTPALPVSVIFGDGLPVTPEFAALVFTGVLQVNVRIPDGAPVGDSVPLSLAIGAYRSPEVAVMSIR